MKQIQPPGIVYEDSIGGESHEPQIPSRATR